MSKNRHGIGIALGIIAAVLAIGIRILGGSYHDALAIASMGCLLGGILGGGRAGYFHMDTKQRFATTPIETELSAWMVRMAIGFMLLSIISGILGK